MIKLTSIKPNPNNPRVIKDDKFQKLVKSIKEFPKMMELRPMVVNSDMIVLGGNMRLKALKEAGYIEIPDEWIKSAESLSSDEQRRFIIADNVGFGDHDWEVLRVEWDIDQLEDWGLDVSDPNYDESDKIGFESEKTEFNEAEEEQHSNMIAISLSKDEYEQWENVKGQMKVKNDKKALFCLIYNYNESSIN